MTYTIGISSGMFGVAPQEEKVQYLTILRKVAYGATKGVNFTQLDIESINEFNEPWIEESVKTIKSLGLKFGVHGETVAMTGIHTIPLESAIKNDYVRSHARLLEHIRGAGKIGAVYNLLHVSESMPIILLEREFQPAQLVDPWGRTLDVFLDKNPKILEWLLGQKDIIELCRHRGVAPLDDYIGYAIEKQEKHLGRALTDDEKKKAEEDGKKRQGDALKSFVISNDTGYGYERIAYYAVAKWMELNKDSLWRNITGGKKFDDIISRHEVWVPAVACKYIWGHFNPTEPIYADPKPLLDKFKLQMLFETEMAKGGYETYMRVARLLHIYYLVTSLGTPWAGVAVDFEHLLSCALDPKKEIADLPRDAGRWVKIVHLGWPTPHIPAHVPIPLGSEAQLWLYERLLELRQKGFESGILLFERAGLPIDESILSIRKIAEYLDKEIAPKELPEDFFGMKPGGPEITRQLVAIKEHALAPLKGMLVVPEEEYTFLSKAALEKGKRPEEWAKERYR